MSTLKYIQPSFAGGEYSPSLYSRVDIAKYSIGLRRCRNFIIHPHGGASNRPGTKFVAETKDSTKKSRVVRFVFSTDQAYIFEFGHLYIRFYTDQAQIQAIVTQNWNNGVTYAVNEYVTYNAAHYLAIQAGINHQPDISSTYWNQQNAYEIYSPYTEDDIFQLKFEESADVVYITSPDFKTRTLTRLGNADWDLDTYDPVDGPFMPENLTDTTLTASATTGNITLTASASLFNSAQVGALFKLKHYIQGQTVSQAFSGTGTSSGIKCFTTWRVISHGTWTGKFRVEKSTDGGSTWTILRTFSSTGDFNANTSGTEDIELNPDPFLVRVNFYDYTSGTANIDLTTDAFFQEGIAQATTYNSATSMSATVVTGRDIGLTSSTLLWAEGSWSDYRGWPSVARFFQDRLCFSGTYTEPMTNWLTNIGNYISFRRHTPLLDTDGISTNLPTRQVNAINGLVALRKLIAFTSASEWSIGPVTGSVLTPTTIEQIVQGYRGSYGVDPAIVGNEAIYIQANSKVVRNLQYQLAYDTFTGSDLNILARHLFEAFTIVEIAYQQDPDSVVWVLRDDGILLGLTYMAEQEVVAWHWHDTGFSDSVSGGDNPRDYIESITTIPGQGFDELWMIVNRTNGRFVERMTRRIVAATCSDQSREIHLDDSYFVDSGVTYGETQIAVTKVSASIPITITAPGHGFSNGNLVRFGHMTEYPSLNGNSYIVDNVTTNTFTISAIQEVTNLESTVVTNLNSTNIIVG